MIKDKGGGGVKSVIVWRTPNSKIFFYFFLFFLYFFSKFFIMFNSLGECIYCLNLFSIL